MKRVSIKRVMATLASLTILSTTTYASDLVVPVGVVVRGANVEVMVAPSSVIAVDLVSESVSFEPGVYARYAQKFLGVRAPLIAKSSSQIVWATIKKQTEGERTAMNLSSPKMATQSSNSADGSLQVDITSATTLQPEEAAQNAANEIFRLRKLRKEILSGDLGEGFYGAGLQAALNDFDRQERELTLLFMGRTEVKSDRKSFSISITNGEKRHIICRLSQSDGIVDETDLSAEPVMLQITPSNSEKIVAPAADEKSEIRKFRVADMTKCELFVGTKLLTQSTMPLFEFGYDLNYPITVYKK
ncbi:MAG: DUF4831 family protein [Rikenellaceae bacterium]